MKQKAFRLLYGSLTVLLTISIGFLCLGIFALNRNTAQIDAAAAKTETLTLQLEESIALENIDEPTQCYNYTAFIELFKNTVAGMTPDSKIALINLSFGSNVRGLKYINDNYGHVYGNHAVKHFASIAHELYAEDNFVLGYRGGSNFYVLCTDVTDEQILLDKAEQFKELWHDTPLDFGDGLTPVDGLALHITIAMVPEDGFIFEDLKEQLGYAKDCLREQGNYGCGFVRDYKEVQK